MRYQGIPLQSLGMIQGRPQGMSLMIYRPPLWPRTWEAGNYALNLFPQSDTLLLPRVVWSTDHTTIQMTPSWVIMWFKVCKSPLPCKQGGEPLGEGYMGGEKNIVPSHHSTLLRMERSRVPDHPLTPGRQPSTPPQVGVRVLVVVVVVRMRRPYHSTPDCRY